MSTLLLTVGKNVLPVAASAVFLLDQVRPTFSEALLIHSSESERDAERLKNFLARHHPSISSKLVRIDAENRAGRTDETRIKSELPRDASPVHLHYSGGTTPMVLKTLRSLPSTRTLSYLSLKTNRLQDENGADLYNGDLRRYFSGKLTPEEIANLHGWEVVKEGPFGPIVPATDTLAPLSVLPIHHPPGNFHEFQINNRLRGVQDKTDKIAFANFPEVAQYLERSLQGTEAKLSRQNGYLEIEVSSSSSQYWNLRDYLSLGGRFEHFVAASLCRAFTTNPGFGPSSKNVYFAKKPNVTQDREAFEIDILFLFGYQLFLVSCTATKDAKGTKLKAFEAIHHAKQLGGSGARTLVVSNIQNELAELDESALHLEIGLSKDDLSLQVWGDAKVQNLDAEFQHYLARIALDKFAQ